MKRRKGDNEPMGFFFRNGSRQQNNRPNAVELWEENQMQAE